MTPTTTTTTYVPLHQHSHYSILQASSKVADLVERAVTYGCPAVSITDNGVMYGALELYQKARNAGIKPIIGCELAIIEGDISDRAMKKPLNHVVLLAQNQQGYQNLVELVSKAHLEGFYYKPRINWDHLAERAEGLICLTGSLNGALAGPVLRNSMDEAEARMKWLKSVFDDRLYLEISDHGLDTEKMVNQAAVQYSQTLNIPLVATNDSHYTHPQDAAAHQILLCLQSGKTLSEASLSKYHDGSYCIKDRQTLFQSFNLDPTLVNQALDNTLLIADRIDLTLELGKSILPDYPVPDGQSPDSYLRQLVLEALPHRVQHVNQETLDRVDYELTIIANMGFPTYFLIVWDFINYARQNNIPVGPGRGSAAGSLVAYALGITNIDPMEHNLLFERFLNPERVSMPDIDIDFCIDRREDVIRYVNERYGQERVCQIITFGTLAARAALKAVCRVKEIPFAESDRLAKLIPGTPGTKLKEAIEPKTPLGQIVESDPAVKELVDIALQIEGCNANTGIHAAGVVIAKDPLTTLVPVQTAKDGQLVTQYSMEDVGNIGLLKMDFLGLRNLTIIDQTLSLIPRENVPPTAKEAPLANAPFDIDRIPLDDQAVYSMLCQAETDGVFQLESSGMRTLVKDLKPSCFEDINALVALYRPGPLNSGMATSFVNRKHGREKVDFPHPSLEPILKDTYGTIVYQEQIMQIAQILGGYSLGQADLLRRAMGKKKPEEMAKQRDTFIAGTQAQGIDDKIANDLFDAMAEFASYCFNRSHSAAYAFIAYQTAYLKAHYPVEYLSALLSSVNSDLDKIQQYMLTARSMDIAILPPDINDSNADFTPTDGAIRFGLASIKNVGEGVVEQIITVRQQGRFTSMEDFAERVSLKAINRRTMECLISVGAFDTFGMSRRKLLNNLDAIYSFAQRHAERKETGQVSLFAFAATQQPDTTDSQAYGEQIVWSGPDTELPEDEVQRLEKELLGFYVSSHPLDSVQSTLPIMVTHQLQSISECSDGDTLVVGGLITSASQRLTKKNKPLLIGQLEDLSGRCEFVAFSETLAQYETILLAGQKVLLHVKFQIRGDDSYSLVVEQARALQEVGILDIYWKTAPRFEEVEQIRSVLTQVKGDDPVILHWQDNCKMVVGKPFWVNSLKAEAAFRSLADRALLPCRAQRRLA